MNLTNKWTKVNMDFDVVYEITWNTIEVLDGDNIWGPGWDEIRVQIGVFNTIAWPMGLAFGVELEQPYEC